ncbi:alginate lyase family protein [Thermoanaerobacterium saccharolyticum]|uniref:alginate lyase family protein n=1 Tax=Thermoanaerobacterium saccharolyticum TaxID=28896 RepID=UPI002FD9D8A4
MIIKYKLLFNTIKYMTFKQKCFRVFRTLQKKVENKEVNLRNIRINNINYNLLFDKSTVEYYRKYYSDISKDVLKKANEICNNKFGFLNLPFVKFKDDIKWDFTLDDYKLWNYNLNYFDYLLELGKAYIITEDLKYLNKGEELIKVWIHDNKKIKKNIWDSYTIAKRIINWIWFINLLNLYHFDFDPIIIKSIKFQIEYLYNHIEYEICANHLVMDAKGLVFAGYFLNENKYIKKGKNLALNELKAEFLCDGGHFERSFSYHIEVLLHYIEILTLLKKYKDNISEQILRSIKPAFDYLYNVIKPNKEIPLVNDSYLDYTIKSVDVLTCGVALFNDGRYKNLCCDKLSEYGLWVLGSNAFENYKNIKTVSEHRKSVLFKDTGYYILRDKVTEGRELYILFDCGNIGPDYNPGHAHADSLNLELSIGNNDVIIDSGTFTYKPGKDRDYFRSTKAHNTITIDDISSSQVWSAFRIGERAHAKIVKFNEYKDLIHIAAVHNGYSKLLGKDKIFHQRSIIYIKNNLLYIIDYLYGSIIKKHKIVLNYILNNDVSISQNNNHLILFKENEYKLNVWFNGEYKLENAVISKYFSIKENTNKIVLEKEISSPYCFLTIIDLNNKYILDNVNYNCTADLVNINNGNNAILKYNLKNCEIY